MTKYNLALSPAAMRDLKKLPIHVQREVALMHLPHIAEAPFQAGKPLVGALSHERSYHFGRRPEYRIIYFIEEDQITVTLIASREAVYKKAKQRK
jgi:mRNA-degrading endonuclease RelE of RelBE toxin-antitoxin system